MIESSVTQRSTVVDRIEREITRLKAARPHLTSRVERAEHILVTHLSTANGMHKPVKVRLHADGSRSFTVRSCSKLRRVYTVEAGTFRCDCPDSRRRHAACKHGIAAYILERVLRRPLQPLDGFRRAKPFGVRGMPGFRRGTLRGSRLADVLRGRPRLPRVRGRHRLRDGLRRGAMDTPRAPPGVPASKRRWKHPRAGDTRSGKANEGGKDERSRA